MPSSPRPERLRSLPPQALPAGTRTRRFSVLLAGSCLVLQAGVVLLPSPAWPVDGAGLPETAQPDRRRAAAAMEEMILAAAARSLCLRADLVPAVSRPVFAGQAGILAQVRVQPGARVARGDTLACLEDQVQRLAHETARQRRAQTQARLDQAGPAYAQGYISRMEYETIEQEARLAALRAAETGLALARTVLAAPVAGQVGEHRLQPGQPVAAAQECFRVEDPTDLAAELAVPLVWVPRLHLGQVLLAQVVGVPGLATLTGSLERLSRAVDPASGGCLATVRFAGAGRQVRPGTPVRIVLGEE